MVVPHANNERSAALGDGAEVPDYGPYAEADWPQQDKGHAAMISRLDGYVGRLLDELRRLELDDHTLVIFTSDNGPHHESRHQLERFRPSGPLRGTKRSLTDGGIRVPAIAWWPGHVAANTVSHHVAYFGDWMATAAQLSGAEVPARCQSISFAPTLLGQTERQAEHEFLYWEFHERGFQQAAIYQGRWKGIRIGDAHASVVLYDLAQDIGEQIDVVAQHPEIAARIGDYLLTARSESPDWRPLWRRPPAAE
jgi:arylsulfatase A-like enzyme